MADEKAPGGSRQSLLGRLDRHLRLWVTSIIFELRRTRRVIVPPADGGPAEPPIFVLGVHRSGTTLVRLILDSHSRIACPPESFFLLPLGSLLSDAKAMEGLAAMGFSRDHVLQRLRETSSYFFEAYARSHHKPRWADKTPSYLDCLELLEELYGPDCRYVVIYRHGLDTACSIADVQIPELASVWGAPRHERLVAAARHWATQCGKLLAFQQAHTERCFELRYEALTTDPEPNLQRLFDFLGEPFEPQVLRFHEQPHDTWIGLQDGKAARSKGFEPRTGVWHAEAAESIRAMIDEAGPMLRRLGHETDGDEAQTA